MAKKINIIANLIDTQLKKQLADIEKSKYKIDVDVDNDNISKTSKHINQVGSAATSTNTTFGKLKSTISDTFSTGRISMTMFLAVLNEIRKAGKNAKQTIEEIDKSITDLAIATNMSREATVGLVADYNKYAKELKSTTTQITSAADDYLHAGKTMNEAQALIEDSIMLSKLGQLDSSEATEDLLATMNGFEMSIEEVGEALDAMVAIDMKAATSAGDIATALKYSASSADMAGLTFNKLAAMLGTVQDKTQQSAETVGTFMNTLLSRYRNVKIGQFVDDDGEDLSKVETILSSLNIRLRDSSQEFRNFEEVIDEVALNWQNYSSVQQAAIAKAFSGTRQQNRFIALMEGYNKTLELTEVAANSAGTAVEKFNNSYMNSLEAKQNTLQASFESMVINSDFDEVYSGIIEATTAMVDFINQTNALKGIASGIAVSGAVKAFLAIKTGINESYIALNKFGNALNIVKKTRISTRDFDRLLLLSNGLSTSQMKLILSTNNLSLSRKKQLLMANGLSEQEAILQLQTWKMTSAQTGLTAATTTLGNAFKGLWATLIANPFILLTTVVSGAAMAYQSYNQKLEETRQKNIEASETAIENANSLKALYNEYIRLASIQERTSSEEEEFKTVVEDVTKALGDKAKVLEGLTAGTNEYADALANATKEELQSALVEATVGRKSAEEELQKKIWSDWQGSKVSVDSNSKGKALSDEAQRAVDVVSDSLREFQTINQTWDNTSWDISSDNPEEALKFYNALVDAREKLVLASENDEELLNTEIYGDLNSAINTMSESLDSYIEKKYEEEKLIYMSQNGIPKTTEEYEKLQESLYKTAGTSEDLKDRFSDLLMADFSELASGLEATEEAQDNLLNAAQEMQNSPVSLSISSTIDQLNTQLKPAMDSLKSAWQDIFTSDGFALDNVDRLSMFDSIQSKLDELNEMEGITVDYSSFENLVRVLNNTESTEFDVKNAFNDLATTIASVSISSAEDFNTLKASLEDLGVVNNEIVAFSALISNTEALKAADIDLATATEEDIEKFVDAAISAENYEQALNLVKIQQILCNENPLNSADSISQLMTLANAAGIASEYLGELYNLQMQYDHADDSGKQVIAQRLIDLRKEVEAEFANATIEYDFSPKNNNSNTSKATEKEIDIMAELNSEMDKLQSSYKSLCEIRDTFNENGKITIDQYQELTDMGYNFLANLVDENGQLGVNANAFEELSRAKLEEMQIQMARNAIDTINGIKSEIEATEYLTYANENLRNAALSSTEAMLYQAQAAAHLKGEQQGLAADQILKGYEASKLLVGKVDFSMDTASGEDLLDKFNAERRELEHLQKMDQISNKEFYERLMKLAEKYFGGKEEYKEDYWSIEEEVHDYLESIKKRYDWIENLLESFSKKTNALIDKAEKFISWQKKNAMINRAVKATDNEISKNQSAYETYMKKANSVGLSNDYIRKIQNGTLKIEEIANEELSEKIEKYQEWYDKAQDVLETINELYDQERDLIRQKLDNVLNYYSDLDSYLSSITSKVESLISLNDSMGKRSSLTELVSQFAEVSNQLTSAINKATDITRTEIDFGESKYVNAVKKEDNQKLIDSIQAQIDNLDVTQSGTYTKLLKNIASYEAKIQKYEDKGWNVTKAKQYESLKAKLEDYYELQAELDANATSNTIVNYSKIYTAYQKLQNKIDSGKTLTKSQQKKYDSYLQQMEQLKNSKDSILSELETQLGLANGSISDDTKEKKIREKIDTIQSDLESTATYQNLIRSIEQTEAKLAVLEEKGYDNLTKSQKKTYDKLTKTLEDYYEKKQALDENATASNIVEYNKIYTAWKQLQDKLDAGNNLTTDQWKKYNQYTKQLEDFASYKENTLADLQSQLDEVINPGNKLDVIEREYEKSAEGIYDSYQKQIDGIENAVTETEQYQNLLAKAQKLEQKKDTNGLTTGEQATLDKYNAMLEALRNGGTAENIADYMSTWEKWYTLDQKLQKNGKLSNSDAKKYDTYTAQLKAWNEEKQSQINDLVSLMEDELEALQKTYTENIADAESEINDYYANLYDLAKQIAEYNLGTLEKQLSFLDAYINYYKEIVSLYDSFSGDKLAKILTDLDIGLIESQESLYGQYLAKLQDKYDVTLSKINEYNELIEAINTNDFEGSMELFQKAIADYNASGQTEMASKLQSVLDLLNERAVDADNWGEYADEWLNEWNEALAEAKTELINTATSIQEVNDALREISFSNITNSIKELSNAQDILSSIAGLINDDWMYGEDGNLTQYGITKVGLLVEEIERAKQEVNKYAELIESINSMKDTYSSETAYQDALQEAKMNYFNSLSELQNYQDSVVSILTKADEAVIDSLKNVIEKRKEALQKKKELYEYNKNIQNSQKEIDSIKAQIDALESLSGAMDAATKAKLAQLKADLKEKEDTLQETKDDHTYNLQIDALDEFLDTLDSTMSNVSDSVNKSFETYVQAINSAMEIYNKNKDYLSEWSSSIIETTMGLGGAGSGNSTDLGLSLGDSSTTDNETSIPSLNITNSDTASAIQETSAKTQDTILSIKEALDNGILVKADDVWAMTNPEMMNFVREYIPPMAINVNQTIPNLIRERNPVVINNHYDCLVNVEGNVDKNVAKLLPQQLEQAYKYVTDKQYHEIMRLK